MKIKIIHYNDIHNHIKQINNIYFIERGFMYDCTQSYFLNTNGFFTCSSIIIKLNDNNINYINKILDFCPMYYRKDFQINDIIFTDSAQYRPSYIYSFEKNKNINRDFKQILVHNYQSQILYNDNNLSDIYNKILLIHQTEFEYEN